MEFRLTEQTFKGLKDDKMPEAVINRLRVLTEKGHATEKEFLAAVRKVLSAAESSNTRPPCSATRRHRSSRPPPWESRIRSWRITRLLLAALIVVAVLVVACAAVLRWQAAIVASLLVVLLAFLGLIAPGYLGIDHLDFVASKTAEFFGADPKTFAGEVLRVAEKERMAGWRKRVHEINWELFDRGRKPTPGMRWKKSSRPPMRPPMRRSRKPS